MLDADLPISQAERSRLGTFLAGAVAASVRALDSVHRSTLKAFRQRVQHAEVMQSSEPAKRRACRVSFAACRRARIRRRAPSGNDWVKCTLGMLWGAEVAQSLMRLTCKPFQKPRDKARFTDTRFARKQHHLTFATVRPRPAKVRWCC